ncbi:MAG: EAL domain-containing protein [Bacillota bacterium]|nr:EAL domain-containing protein [Bacillota bacterium]
MSALLTVEELISSDGIRTLLQPLVRADDGGVYGYEALSRGPAGSPLEGAEALWRAAEAEGRVVELDYACRRAALRAKRRWFPDSGTLFVNVDPLVVRSPSFRLGVTQRWLYEMGIDPGQVVLEITERRLIDDYEAFRRALRIYRDEGYRVAVDDVGAGYSSLRTVAEIQPHFLKIDISLIRGLHLDRARRAVVAALVDLAHALGALAVAEGVEEPEELRAVTELGVDLVQGFLLARPAEEPPLPPPAVLTHLRRSRRPRRRSESARGAARGA